MFVFRWTAPGSNVPANKNWKYLAWKEIYADARARAAPISHRMGRGRAVGSINYRRKLSVMSGTVVRHPSSQRERSLVLLIEDNLTQLDLYTMVLSEQCVVVTATRGETGYELACSEQPDAIVMDVLLPDVNGLALCKRLRANPSTASIPVIVLTGDNVAYARAQLVRSELTGVLLKPCPADRLLSAVRQSVERRS